LRNTNLDLLVTQSAQIEVVASNDGFGPGNTVNGYSITGVPMNPLNLLGSFTYTGTTLAGMSPSSIFNGPAGLNIPLFINGTAAVLNTDAAWIIQGGASNDTLLGGVNADTFTAGLGTDSILGGEGADSILGEAGADIIDAGNGNNFVNGGADADSIVGGSGLDTFLGGIANDTLLGGAGADSLTGFGVDSSTEQDSLTGGADSDIFVLGGASNVNGYSGGLALISDYNATTGLIATADRIQVSDLNNNAGTWGFSAGVGADNYFITNSIGGNIYSLTKDIGGDLALGTATYTLQEVIGSNTIAKFQNMDNADLTALISVDGDSVPQNWSFV
jgi:Ca2+-binding RTX toxin-like protein